MAKTIRFEFPNRSHPTRRRPGSKVARMGLFFFLKSSFSSTRRTGACQSVLYVFGRRQHSSCLSAQPTVWLRRDEPSPRRISKWIGVFQRRGAQLSQQWGKRKNCLSETGVPGPVLPALPRPLPRGLPESSRAGSRSTLSEHFASRRAQRACKGWG